MRNLNYFSLPTKFKQLSSNKNSFENKYKRNHFEIKNFFLVNDCLITRNAEVFFVKKEIKKYSLKKNLIFLGMHSSTLYYFTSISDQVYKKETIFKNTNKLKIRDSIKLHNSFLASLITYACTIQDWRQSNLYCGKCGSKTLLKEYESVIICLNEYI